MKRLSAPKFWGVPNKEKKWATRPRPGPHGLRESIPLQVIVRDILGIADIAKEAKRIIKGGNVVVDGKTRKDHKYPAGLMDAVSIPSLEQYYRVTASEKGLKLITMPKSEADRKICRIMDKSVVRGGKTQLNLHDGRNVLVDGKFSTGDSILIELPSQKIIEHVEFDKGKTAIVVKGRNSGSMGKIMSFTESSAKEKAKVVIKTDGGKIEVVKDYVFVVGNDSPLVKLSGD